MRLFYSPFVSVGPIYASWLGSPLMLNQSPTFFCVGFGLDMGLEYEDNDLYRSFRDFYYDIIPEFKSVGRVVNIKVCCNHEPHLRGNVYVQYKRWVGTDCAVESSALCRLVHCVATQYSGETAFRTVLNISPKWS